MAYRQATESRRITHKRRSKCQLLPTIRRVTNTPNEDLGKSRGVTHFTHLLRRALASITLYLLPIVKALSVDVAKMPPGFLFRICPLMLDHDVRLHVN